MIESLYTDSMNTFIGIYNCEGSRLIKYDTFNKYIPYNIILRFTCTFFTYQLY